MATCCLPLFVWTYIVLRVMLKLFTWWHGLTWWPLTALLAAYIMLFVCLFVLAAYLTPDNTCWYKEEIYGKFSFQTFSLPWETPLILFHLITRERMSLWKSSITVWRTYRIRYSSLHFTTHMALAGTYARNMHVALTWPPGAWGINQRHDLRVWSTFARYWQLLTSGYSSVSLPTNPQNYSCFWWQNLKCLWSMSNRDTAWRQLDQHDTWTSFFLRSSYVTAREDDEGHSAVVQECWLCFRMFCYCVSSCKYVTCITCLPAIHTSKQSSWRLTTVVSDDLVMLGVASAWILSSYIFCSRDTR